MAPPNPTTPESVDAANATTAVLNQTKRSILVAGAHGTCDRGTQIFDGFFGRIFQLKMHDTQSFGLERLKVPDGLRPLKGFKTNLFAGDRKLLCVLDGDEHVNTVVAAPFMKLTGGMKVTRAETQCYRFMCHVSQIRLERLERFSQLFPVRQESQNANIITLIEVIPKCLKVDFRLGRSDCLPGLDFFKQ